MIVFKYIMAALISIIIFALFISIFAVLGFGGNRVPGIIGMSISIIAFIISMRFFGSLLTRNETSENKAKINVITVSLLVVIFMVWGIVLYIGASRSDEICRPINLKQCRIDGEIRDIEK